VAGKTHCTRFSFSSFLVLLASAALKFQVSDLARKKAYPHLFSFPLQSAKLISMVAGPTFPSNPWAYVCIKYATTKKYMARKILTVYLFARVCV